MPSKTYVCKFCKRTRAVKFFERMAVCTLRESDELEELSCVDCKGYENFAAKEYYCIASKKKKPFNAFLGCTRKKITQGNHGYTQLFCGDCQYPPCKICGKRAEDAISGRQREAGYYCETCGWIKNPKQCKNEACKGIRTLECYPEETQAVVLRHRNIMNGRHLCSQCSRKKVSTRRARSVGNRQKRLSLVICKEEIIAIHVDGRNSRSCAGTRLAREAKP